jgi:hypothetical protein
MKKGVVLFGILFLVLTIGVNSILAEEVSEKDQVILAYNCLRDTVDATDCDSLSIGEKIFSLLSVKDCRSELLDQAQEDSDDEAECWPDGRCDVKTTAQSILALHESNVDTDVAQEWLLNQRMVPTELVWYLEIDTNVKSTCTVSYRNNPYNIEIGEDKIITGGNLGACLSFGPDWSGNYWLEINPTCYEEEFEISCNESFLTTLLYHEEDSKTIHVMDHIWSRPANGVSVERIKSYCFEKSGSCNYEGSLWAAIVLDYLGEDISEFIPYLVTTYESHRNDFPEPFLYMLTGELQYKTDTLEAQINEQYWKKGTDKYYDSALALLPFKNEAIYEKDNTITWLLDIQQDDGCWDGGNIINNGFILYSIWPHLGPGEGGIIDDENTTTTDYDNDCILSNYFCMSARNCEGNVLGDYDCEGLYVCCDKENVQPTCTDLSGEVCASNEYCLGGDTESVVGLSSGESCCVEGTCETRTEPEENQCVSAGGICEPFSCASGYEESLTDSCSFGDTCCVSSGKTQTGKYLWVWILFILVILIVVAIIYREKIKELYMKMKSGKGPVAPQQMRRPGYPPAPGYNRMPSMPPVQRKIMPPQPRPIQRPAKNPRELDDVLRKLKEMGK